MAGPGTLFVFLHGYCVVAERGKWLEVVLPDIPGHVNKAGGWLTESAIARKGVLRLTGVETGNESFAKHPLTILLKGCYLTSRARAATLWLPWPARILPLLIAERDPNSPSAGLPVVQRTDNLARWTQAPSLTVLVYNYRDDNQVSLENHYWEPCTVNRAVSLHVIADSEKSEGTFHEVQTEEVIAKVIGRYPGMSPDPRLKFPEPRPVVPNWLTPNARNLINVGLFADHERIFTQAGQFGQYAFSQAEMEEIGPRSVRLRRVGRIKQQGRPLQNLWHDPDPLDGELPDCLSVAVQR
jgi:hypothetical protein